MLCWHFSKEALQEEEVLANAAVKLRVEIFCLAWCSSSLRTGRGTLATGAPGGLGVIEILAKSIQLLNFILKCGLSHLVPLRSGRRRLDIFALR